MKSICWGNFHLNCLHNAKEITWQTVYEQLQEILNKCIDLWWNYKFLSEHLECHTRWCIDFDREISYHELFSKDSGIMEFVEWERTDLARDLDSMLDRSDWYEYWSSKCHTIKELHEMIMAKMTAEEKCSYFVKNARVPTK